MSAIRERLPTRRASQQFTFACNTQRYVATVSFFPDGRLAEIFIGNTKSGSHSGIRRSCARSRCSTACPST
jgi:hypothetical protein